MGWKSSTEHHTEFHFVVINAVSQIIPTNLAKQLILGYWCLKWYIFWYIGMKHIYKCKTKKSYGHTHLQKCISSLPWIRYLTVYLGNCTVIKMLPFMYCLSENIDYWDFFVIVLFLVYYLYPLYIIITIQTEWLYFYFRLYVFWIL